jgi:hypothetical protein
LTGAEVLKVNGHDPTEFGGGGVVDVCLGYTTISWTVTKQKLDGSAGPSITTEYDVAGNKIT